MGIISLLSSAPRTRKSVAQSKRQYLQVLWMPQILWMVGLLLFGFWGCSSSSTAVDDEANGGTDTCSGEDCGDVRKVTEVGRAICGNGEIEGGENCDDGNTEDDDGCSSDCVEIGTDYVCPNPGEGCFIPAVCGDGEVWGDERCDDGNTVSFDGCSAFCDQIEADFDCPVEGQACIYTVECGDGALGGAEQCDDGNLAEGDGCSPLCQLEPGYKCDVPNTPCTPTVCGDNIVEGSEQCDDANNDTGDGCNPLCEREPNCDRDGYCVPVCGDSVKLPGEECDDGNTQDGDGCSSTCMLEDGFTCTDTTPEPPESISVPIIYRDFIGWDCREAANNANCSFAGAHPDFQRFSGSTASPNMVETDLSPIDHKPVVRLRGDGYPYYSNVAPVTSGLPYGSQLNTKEAFDQWFRDTEGVNRTVVDILSLDRQVTGEYVFDSGSGFFPLTGIGFMSDGTEPGRNNGNNFSFTSEVRYWFEYEGGEELSFSGDDDVWVFINGKLTVDLGGLHPPQSGSVTLNADTIDADGNLLGLAEGRIYEAVVYHAERHTGGSNYRLTLGGFNAPKTSCEFICGDGIVTPQEACDDGRNDGSYGSCMPDCLGPAPYCGDSILQDEEEACDFGRLANVGGYNGCNPDCTLAPRCGDNEVSDAFGEQCDDGNQENGDGCSSTCQNEGIILE